MVQGSRDRKGWVGMNILGYVCVCERQTGKMHYCVMPWDKLL